MSKDKGKIIISLFIIVIGMPYFLWFFLSDYFDVENYEKRKMAEKPVFQWERVDEFSIDVENYINDTLPFRNSMIRLYNMLEYYVFHNSNNENVIIGKDGWLFYKESTDMDSMECYKGTNLFSEEELQKIANNLITTRDNLAARGCEFVLFIPSNKERIYSEFVPDYYGEPAKEYATLQLVNYIKEHTDIRVVYPYNAMMETKEKLDSEVLLYHKTDTHWNGLGAYIGARELLKELEIEIPSLEDNSIEIVEENDIPGDLADLLNLGDQIDIGNKYRVSGYAGEEIESLTWKFEDTIIGENSGKDPRRIFVVRDSFGNAMANPIVAQFNNSYMVPAVYYEQRLVEEWDPDIFVYEVLERYVTRLLTFKYEGSD